MWAYIDWRYCCRLNLHYARGFSSLLQHILCCWHILHWLMALSLSLSVARSTTTATQWPLNKRTLGIQCLQCSWNWIKAVFLRLLHANELRASTSAPAVPALPACLSVSQLATATWPKQQLQHSKKSIVQPHTRTVTTHTHTLAHSLLWTADRLADNMFCIQSSARNDVDSQPLPPFRMWLAPYCITWGHTMRIVLCVCVPMCMCVCVLCVRYSSRE